MILQDQAHHLKWCFRAVHSLTTTTTHCSFWPGSILRSHGPSGDFTARQFIAGWLSSCINSDASTRGGEIKCSDTDNSFCCTLQYWLSLQQWVRDPSRDLCWLSAARLPNHYLKFLSVQNLLKSVKLDSEGAITKRLLQHQKFWFIQVIILFLQRDYRPI